MDPSSNHLDIFDIYSRFCDIKSGIACARAEKCMGRDDESETTKLSREALAQLLKFVESRLPSRDSIFNELFKLMSRLNLLADFAEFACFYEFVFFICRENGQKNITVSKAITAWKLVLAGRFRLLYQWCEFVQKNQRYNISEDTWQQVLAFSRCVHETLEGYDPAGAWPVLIDDFVEHMYRVSGSGNNTNFHCTCDDSESRDDPLPRLKSYHGLKRKFNDDFTRVSEGLSETCIEDSTHDHWSVISKRRHKVNLSSPFEDSPPTDTPDDFMENVRHSSPLGTKSPCAVEGCLSKGFAGLFSGRSYLPYNRERRVSYT
ncbi:defective in cullin neddylation protein AAR3 [Syzygium oleosum]|uniref:defective in cullin neddylation protein AAR3 n=1 Tax=Syzygium oleosum TaxID=219896 RepID=UPI0011D270CD|nr:defective in cullin neddylation protein AAR3 [Syzygium oleosum]